MASIINLLPESLAEKRLKGKFWDTIRKITPISIIVFIALAVLVGTYLLLLTLQIRSSRNNIEILKSNLVAVQQTEQGMVFLKDRLKLIEAVLAEKGASEAISNFGTLASLLPPSLILIEVKITGEVTELSYIARASADLATLIRTISEDPNYKKIKVRSFNFNPTSGYLVTLELF